MGLFSKKEEKQEEENISDRKGPIVPQPLPRNNSKKMKLPPLPKLHDLPTDVNSIKHSISPDTSPQLPEVQAPNTVETPIALHSPEKTMPHISPPMETSMQSEPIFVKIDKFKTAVDNFDKVKEKVGDIEDMLHKIKSIREKEDQELKEWEHEVQMIRSRVENIDNSLFKKVGRK